ncbi:MAG: hypothetical protein V4662_11935 [Verrucomicrobiota bacterium]
MAFDDTHCPCTGKKEAGTMLCPACERELSGTPEMRMFTSCAGYEARRMAAISLVRMSRRRSRQTLLIP